jgi:hypothetical protein
MRSSVDVATGMTSMVKTLVPRPNIKIMSPTSNNPLGSATKGRKQFVHDHTNNNAFPWVSTFNTDTKTDRQTDGAIAVILTVCLIEGGKEREGKE